jgi:hypothetical protein
MISVHVLICPMREKIQGCAYDKPKLIQNLDNQDLIPTAYYITRIKNKSNFIIINFNNLLFYKMLNRTIHDSSHNYKTKLIYKM